MKRLFPQSRRELAIRASSRDVAMRAWRLIGIARALGMGEPDGLFATHELSPKHLPEQPTQLPSEAEFLGAMTNGLEIGCLLAAKASRSRRLQYALALYGLSQQIHSNWTDDLHPSMYPYASRSTFPGDHARFAYAIVTSYSVVEQLGLALNGPAFSNQKWMPAVRAELRDRLLKAGEDPDSPALLQLRGPRALVETNRQLEVVRRAAWARGKVRDCEVDLLDAIAHLRWLRSGVGAHRLGELAGKLSIDDVANAQHLARRLLLTSLGFPFARLRRHYEGD
jgi:hypothetical protein